MRLVEVQEREDRMAGAALDPRGEDRRGRDAGALVRRRRLEPIVVEVEARGEPPVPAQRERRHGGAGGVAHRLETRRQRRMRRAQPETDVVADAVLIRQKPRQ